MEMYVRNKLVRVRQNNELLEIIKNNYDYDKININEWDKDLYLVKLFKNGMIKKEFYVLR